MQLRPEYPHINQLPLPTRLWISLGPPETGPEMVTWLGRLMVRVPAPTKPWKRGVPVTSWRSFHDSVSACSTLEKLTTGVLVLMLSVRICPFVSLNWRIYREWRPETLPSGSTLPRDLLDISNRGDDVRRI